MSDKRTAELRDRILRDYDLQAAAITSVLESFTSWDGRAAKALAVVEEDKGVRDYLDASGALEFSIAADFMDARDVEPYLENGVTITYVPETGASFVSHGHYDANADTNSPPHPPELLPLPHNVKGWDAELREKLVDNLSRLQVSQMENLEVTLKATDEFMMRKLVTVRGDRLLSRVDPEEARRDMDAARMTRP